MEQHRLLAQSSIQGEIAEDVLDVSCAITVMWPDFAFSLNDLDYDELHDMYLIPVPGDVYEQVAGRGTDWHQTQIWDQPDDGQILFSLSIPANVG